MKQHFALKVCGQDLSSLISMNYPDQLERWKFLNKKRATKTTTSRFSTSQVFFIFHRFHRFPEVGSIDFSSFFLGFSQFSSRFSTQFSTRSAISQDQLQISGKRPSLVAFRQQCRDAARRLEQLVVDAAPGAASTSTVDPSALLAEARRRDLGNWNHGGGDKKNVAKDI